jgi:hypothetical protein
MNNQIIAGARIVAIVLSEALIDVKEGVARFALGGQMTTQTQMAGTPLPGASMYT